MVAPNDVARVAQLLGRRPSASFEVVVRDASGEPVVIENAPLLEDGTPLPTRYWLVGREARQAVGRLESLGGVRAAEAAVDPGLLAAAHARYAAARDAALPAGHPGPRPSGGVGGTRQGVKCLHAHLAWYLAGGRDPVGRFVVDRLAGELEGPVAAIDLGTNSTRLLVLDPSGATLAREMTITRLGEGVDRTGRLAPAAIARTVAAIVAFREQAESFGAVRFRAAATSAAREAANAEDLAAAVDEALGTPLDILSGEEEGRLAYRGATVNIGTAGEPTLVVDVGGGSTELIAPALDGSGVVAVSLPIGCVRVSERFLASDPPSQDQLLEARSAIRALLVGALDGQPALRAPRRMIGVAGTVAALVGLKLGAEVSDRARLHGAKLTRDEVERLGADLAAEPIRLRRERPGLEPERADVIVGGALVLSEVLAATGHFALEHSESDLLDAMAAGLLSDEPGATA